MRRLEFENGWIIDVHLEKDGETYYQRWEPTTGLTDLRRMTSADFEDEIKKHPHRAAQAAKDKAA